MSTKQIEKSATEIHIPDDVKVSIKGDMLHVEGPLGHVYKNFRKIPVACALWSFYYQVLALVFL